MSFSITPISDPFPPPLVDAPQSATDRQRARDERQRQRHAPPHPEPEQPKEADLQAAPDADAPPPIGTLIDVRAWTRIHSRSEASGAPAELGHANSV